MRFKLFLFAAPALGLVLSASPAQAQSPGTSGAMAANSAAPNPADPQAQVPPLIYRSVFGGASQGLASESLNWREANDLVGQFKRGHADVLKWEQQADSAREGGTVPAPGTKNPTLTKP